MVALLIREAYSTFIRYSGTSYEKVLAARQASGYRNKRGVRKIRRLPIYHFDESSDGRLLYAINGDKVFFMFRIHPRIPEADRSLSRLPQSLSQFTQNLFARSRTRLHAGGSEKAVPTRPTGGARMVFFLCRLLGASYWVFRAIYDEAWRIRG